VRVLVTGDAGYIGSVITDQLIAAGHTVVVLDNLSKGPRDAVSEAATFVHGDLSDGGLVAGALAAHEVDAVVHMAASSLVGESMTMPEASYRNNVVAGLELLRR
jgi:UDP-glucose 4-epimerase